jgi:predicted alpha/beta-hydrolase family hydrolase
VSAVSGVLLFPGAGSGSDHPSLIAVEEKLSPLPVRRNDFEYRIEGRKAPDRPRKLISRVRECADTFAADLGTSTSQLVLGGRSMGGRMCSMVAAGVPDTDGLDALPVAGVILISYPLHPPAKPESLRVEHFERLNVPCLFIQGTKDEFGSPEELQEWTAKIPGEVTHHFVQHAHHEMKKKDGEIAEVIQDWLNRLIGNV